MTLSPTAQRAVNAYGGANLWQSYKYIEAEVSVSGLAFALKRRPFFEHAKIRMEIGRPYSRITPIGKVKNISGIMESGNVRLENEDGIIIDERKNARSYFPYGRRLFYWDDLDMAYFANYAFWNYFTLPRLLLNESIEWNEREASVLEATFPDSLPTHCKQQEFHFDKVTGLLTQHNYTAEIIGNIARAANVVKEHNSMNGLTYPSLRRVTPRTKNGNALNRPLLIEIQVYRYKLTK